MASFDRDDETAACIVCHKQVAKKDQADHLATNHLGPHYFWFDAKKYRTMEPSMTMGQVKALVGASMNFPVFEDRDGNDIPWGDGVAVDLTREPHFFAVPPTTW